MSGRQKKAVSLSYPEWAAAPFVSAKAEGDRVEQVLEIAREHNVPIVQNDALVQVLSAEKIGAHVPEDTWVVLAKIFAFIMEQNPDKYFE